MIKPSVFVLGVQKCGTTTVADLLARQPEVFVPSIKETYFFCDESHYARGEDWYQSEFYSPRATKSASLFCDATPFYMASLEALDRIASFADASARYIVCLREPVSRAYSAYWHQCRLGNEPLNFEAALAAESCRIAAARADRGRWWRHAYVEVGHYGAHLEQAFDRLGQSNFLILTEDNLSNMEELQATLRSFLDLPERNEKPCLERSNAASMPRFAFLQDLVIRDNPIKRIASALIPRELRTSIGNSLLNANQKAFRYPPMDLETQRTLRAHFAGDLAKLEALGIAIPKSWRGLPT